MKRLMVGALPTLILVLTMFVGHWHAAAAASFTSKVASCNASYRSCVRKCGKTAQCTVRCGRPWEQCTNKVLASKASKAKSRKSRK